MNTNTSKRRGRAVRDQLTEAIQTFTQLSDREYAAAQECVAAMRTLAAARADAAKGDDE